MVQSLSITIPSSLSMMDVESLDATTPSDEASSPLADIPLTALSKATRRQLSNLLNAKKILRSEEGYERDWRGIAALAQQKNLCDENTLGGDDPMNKLIQLWCSNNPKTATIGHLEQYLGFIDRWDVCDDIYENLVADARNYNAKSHQKSIVPTDTPAVYPLDVIDDFGQGSNPNILTKDDVLRAQKGLPPQKYDAFVLFADADINYVVEMLTKLEDSPQYNFKLCLKDRDLLAGVSFMHVALTQLIEERCKHLIVILTEDFIRSQEENKFLVNYTQALQIQHRTRKIIPLLYDDSVIIPGTLKIYTHLKYNANTGTLFDFWGKLAASIRDVNISVEATPSPLYTKETYRVCAPPPEPDTHKISLTNLPTPPADIPSININGMAFEAEDEVPKLKDRKFKKRSSLRHNVNKLFTTSNGTMLRNAHSTSQLNCGYQDSNASLSDLSTTSGCSDLKKKKKWPGKLFKKVFSRSSTKLQGTA